MRRKGFQDKIQSGLNVDVRSNDGSKRILAE